MYSWSEGIAVEKESFVKQLSKRTRILPSSRRWRRWSTYLFQYSLTNFLIEAGAGAEEKVEEVVEEKKEEKVDMAGAMNMFGGDDSSSDDDSDSDSDES